MPTKSVSPDSDELLQEVANHLLKSRKVVVITGAGISTNSGIPDFRSENGLYSLIQAQLDAAEKIPGSEVDAEGPTGSDQQQSDVTDNARPAKQRRLSKDAAAASEVESRTPKLDTRLSRVRNGTTKNRSPLSRTTSAPATDNTPFTRSRRAASLPPNRQDVWSQLSDPATAETDAIVVGGSQEERECTRRRSPRRARSISPPSNSPTKKYLNTPQQDSPAPSRRVSQLSNLLTRERPATRRVAELPGGSSPLSSPPPSAGRSPMSLRQAASEMQHTPSRLAQPPMIFDSSPLSSPPPILFDPFEHPSSTTSQQDSSENGSSESSETDETPPSSMPSLASSHGSKRSSLPTMKGRDMFDVSIWADPLRTSVFYTFATTLRQKARDVEPTSSHRFISHLRDRGKLVRCYTQNIDQIEEKVGLSTSLQQGPGQRGRFSRKSTGGAFSAAASKESGSSSQKPPTLKSEASSGGVECVFLHGSLQSLRCFLCGRVCEWDENNRSQETLFGRQPECPHCVGAAEARVDKGKRALGVGKLRPDIVLYGEEHPNAHLIDPIVNHDLALYPDFLLILGTSLKVHGLKRLVREFAKTIHCRGGKVVFVNLTKPPESSWGDIIDYWIEWDCDAWVSSLQERIPLMWLPPGTKLPAPAKKKRQSTGEGRPTAKKRESSGLKSEVELTATNAADSGDQTTPKTEDCVAVQTKTEAQQESGLDEKLSSLPVTKKKGSDESNEQVVVAKAPQRPACLREDRFSAASLTWQISRDLRRISGNNIELELLSSKLNATGLSPTSTADATASLCSEIAANKGQSKKKSSKSTRKSLPNLKKEPDTENKPKKAKKAKTRKSAPGWVYVSVDEDEEDEPVIPEVQEGEGDEQSILAAVKSNPRKRKRKIIDGMEIALPMTGQRAGSAKAAEHPKSSPGPKVATQLPRKLPQPIAAGPVSPRHNKENDLIVSPKIMSDLNRVSMNSLELPPIRPSPRHQQIVAAQQQPDQGLKKPAPLEPQSPPSGPLATIAPNVAAAQARPLAASRAYQEAALRPCPPPPATNMYTSSRFQPFHHQYLPPRPLSLPRQGAAPPTMPPSGYASYAYPAAFSYFDALVHQLREPPFGGSASWTPEAQLKKETDEAAAALSQLRTERR